MGITIGNHGVNPSMVRCFWCGETKELALFGRLPTHRAEQMFGEDNDDVRRAKKNGQQEMEAPREIIMGLQPCTDCPIWKRSSEGCFVVEVTGTQEHPKYTGSFTLVRDEAIKRWLKPGPVQKEVLEKRCMMLHRDDYQAVFGGANPG